MCDTGSGECRCPKGNVQQIAGLSETFLAAKVATWCVAAWGGAEQTIGDTFRSFTSFFKGYTLCTLMIPEAVGVPPLYTPMTTPVQRTPRYVFFAQGASKAHRGGPPRRGSLAAANYHRGKQRQ